MLTKDFSQYHDVTSDSKEVVKGGIFVAIKGLKNDGHDCIDEALQNGAKLIIVDKSYKDKVSNLDVTKYLEVDDTRKALRDIASTIYEQPKNIVAVTGTNGKTSVACFYRQLIELLGYKSASIGTLGVMSTDGKVSQSMCLTTPPVGQIHKMLHQLKSHGIENVILEASSHGLDQDRIGRIKISTAAFTSFSQDHLNYHGSMENYLKAKLLLFSKVLQDNSIVVINNEMEIADQVIEVCKARGHRIYTYGKAADFLNILSIKYREGKSHVKFLLEGKNYNKSFNFMGDFQIYNILCALCLAIAKGFDKQRCLSVLNKLQLVPGRMEPVDGSNVFVDFAHTPDGLEKALTVLHENKAKGRVIVVFGCGGDRDKGKRSKMGSVANKIADIAIVSDDNPRTEDPAAIRKEIMAHCPKAIEVGGREEAIKTAIEMMKPDDLLLIAGKGHEQTQIIGTEHFHFNDIEVARRYL
jgi:UDP-N-acetylmuramoyl-L-alanyl-D-glutamate--2,6-diaminopimelate ligase